MKKHIDRFKQFLTKAKEDRSKHMSWGENDVEHHEEEVDEQRKKHMSWSNGDVEHHDSDDINEDMANPAKGTKAGVNSFQGGLKNSGGGIPKYWKKGGMGASHGADGTGDVAGLPSRPDHEGPEHYHSDHSDQLGFDTKGFKAPKIKVKKDKYQIHKMDYLPKDESGPSLKRHEDTIRDFAHAHANMGYHDKNTMDYYKSNSYDINGALRDSKGRSAGSTMDRHRAKTLEKITSNKTPKDMVVYRGIRDDPGSNHSEMLKQPTGHQFTDHGFIGTSLRHKVARDFSDNNHIFRIHVPAGTKGHYIDSHPNGHQHEHEFLLHRGTRFKIGQHNETPDGKRVIDLHIVKQRKDK